MNTGFLSHFCAETRNAHPGFNSRRLHHLLLGSLKVGWLFHQFSTRFPTLVALLKNKERNQGPPGTETEIKPILPIFSGFYTGRFYWFSHRH